MGRPEQATAPAPSPGAAAAHKRAADEVTIEDIEKIGI